VWQVFLCTRDLSSAKSGVIHGCGIYILLANFHTQFHPCYIKQNKSSSSTLHSSSLEVVERNSLESNSFCVALIDTMDQLAVVLLTIISPLVNL
jgi:hypothetical protein